MGPNFQPLEVVDRGSETQIQVAENFIIAVARYNFKLAEILNYLYWGFIG